MSTGSSRDPGEGPAKPDFVAREPIMCEVKRVGDNVVVELGGGVAQPPDAATPDDDNYSHGLAIESPPAPTFGGVRDHGGERVKFHTGAIREASSGKGRFDLIPPYPIQRLAQHYEAGAKKYAPRQWEKGLPMQRFIDSAERHMNQFKQGDRSEDHLAAILWNVCGYLHTEREVLTGRLPQDLMDVPWPPSSWAGGPFVGK